MRWQHLRVTGLPPADRFDAIAHRRLDGPLTGRTPLELLSDVLDHNENVTAGLISQAIVAHVLKTDFAAKVTPSHYSWDIELEGPIPGVPSGELPLPVEVRTCSVAQTWGLGRRGSPIAWSCQPLKQPFDPTSGRWRTYPPPGVRPAKLYIFVLREGSDVFDATSYTATALATIEIEARLGPKTSMSKSALLAIRPLVPLLDLRGQVGAAARVAAARRA